MKRVVAKPVTRMPCRVFMAHAWAATVRTAQIHIFTVSIAAKFPGTWCGFSSRAAQATHVAVAEAEVRLAPRAPRSEQWAIRQRRQRCKSAQSCAASLGRLSGRVTCLASCDVTLWVDGAAEDGGEVLSSHGRLRTCERMKQMIYPPTTTPRSLILAVFGPVDEFPYRDTKRSKYHDVAASASTVHAHFSEANSSHAQWRRSRRGQPRAR